mmetsp:Transcript_61638/g.193192  ORF Transcript_61638/g.193192 Transcript_61638/m.193192 type:complete len:205 (+) Transcript_61638:592-1206(+)
MAKSAEFTACRPSRPQMPTPTCASWIIGTSLAPSPTASVTGVGVTFSRTSLTSSAFCMGLTRHAMRTEHCSARWRKCSFSYPLFMMPESAFPVTIIALWTSRSSKDFSALPRVVPSSSSMVWMFISSVSTSVLKPMFRAVSSLSPVSTQSLMPASRSFLMVSGTLSCSLSSMAVAPRISRGLSISSATSSSRCSRSRVSRFAWL